MTIIGVVLGALLSLTGIASGQPTLVVTPEGSFSPPYFTTETGAQIHQPSMLVKTAVDIYVPNSTIFIAPGEYRESGVYSKPTTLLVPSGAAVIGHTNLGDSTTLSIASLNTHLVGDTSALIGATWDYWADDQRAIDIANICAHPLNQWDFVALSEVWDEDFFCDDCCGNCEPDTSVITPILDQSGYLEGRIGDDLHGDFLSSGLAVMSQYPISLFAQLDFQDCPHNPCDGDDCLANKGFVWSTIHKDGFAINIINTHTQASNAHINQITRILQMQCINTQISNHRSVSPNDLYFIVGDLNVPGETVTEYYNNMRLSFPLFNDAVRNVPGFKKEEQYTNSPDNKLAKCFDCGTVDARLDYILFIPASENGNVRVVPRTAGRYKFLGSSITADCDECPDADVATIEKSDHWAVEGEFEIYRP